MITYDYIIIGAGPAGLQMGYFLEKNNKNYLILEKQSYVGSFFTKFPRHRKMLSHNKVFTNNNNEEFNLRHDWNSLLCDNNELLFKNYSKEFYPQADDYIKYLKAFNDYYQLNITFEVEITNIEKNNIFKLDSSDITYYCKYLIIATGTFKPYIPKEYIGIEYAIGYEDMSIDKNDYINKAVLIIGKKNAAFETSKHLLDVTSYMKLSGHSVSKMAWDTYQPNDIRGVNSDMLDSFHLKTLHTIEEWHSNWITKSDDNKYYYRFNKDNKYDYVLRCTGFEFDNSIFNKKCLPTMSNKNIPKLLCQYESINTPNMYFIGTLMRGDQTKCLYSTIGQFRHAIKSLFNILNHKNHHKDLLHKKYYKDMINIILERISNASGLFHLLNYCDTIVIYPDHIKYYEEYPYEYIKSYGQFRKNNIIIINFETELNEDDDTLELNKDSNKLLHPVIRYYPLSYNHPYSSWFDGNALLQCTCGKWEFKYFMTRHHICHSCSDITFCQCGKSDLLVYLSQNRMCRVCKNDHSDLEKYNFTLNSYNEKIKINKNNTYKFYEIHLMEDQFDNYNNKKNHNIIADFLYAIKSQNNSKLTK